MRNPGLPVAVLDDAFTYVAAPTITAVKPARGPVDGGTKVTITGTGFGPDAVVGVGNVILDDAKVVNDSTITFVTPACRHAHQGRCHRDESRSATSAGEAGLLLHCRSRAGADAHTEADGSRAAALPQRSTRARSRPMRAPIWCWTRPPCSRRPQACPVPGFATPTSGRAPVGSTGPSCGRRRHRSSSGRPRPTPGGAARSTTSTRRAAAAGRAAAAIVVASR